MMRLALERYCKEFTLVLVIFGWFVLQCQKKLTLCVVRSFVQGMMLRRCEGWSWGVTCRLMPMEALHSRSSMVGRWYHSGLPNYWCSKWNTKTKKCIKSLLLVELVAKGIYKRCNTVRAQGICKTLHVLAILVSTNISAFKRGNG